MARTGIYYKGKFSLNHIKCLFQAHNDLCVQSVYEGIIPQIIYLECEINFQ